jgi:hypothetical protein
LAAGRTIPEVPIISIKSQTSLASFAYTQTWVGSDSPNPTTPGLTDSADTPAPVRMPKCLAVLCFAIIGSGIMKLIYFDLVK